jgi:hypothetical protein
MRSSFGVMCFCWVSTAGRGFVRASRGFFFKKVCVEGARFRVGCVLRVLYGTLQWRGALRGVVPPQRG